GKNKKYALSFTFDNGGEFAQHQMIAKKLHAEVYFCDPYASYQKGSVEQGNGVIRSELQRKIDFESMT
ncbi:MAG: IS30 family transposase, partial [Gammaproteobacteria bacterium]|nr:IS30 family transposase [Gammaproteobacteria bacterium]